MTVKKTLTIVLLTTLCLGVAACGGRRKSSNYQPPELAEQNPQGPSANLDEYERSSLWDVLGPNNGDQSTQVNRYLWSASLDVLNFLPVQSVDPFTGVIVTGYGTPPGGGRTYRATVHVKDPALEARSLYVSLHTKGGPASAATTRAVEDAILSRARQLRIADRKL